MAAPDTGPAAPSVGGSPLAPAGGEVTASGTSSRLSLRAFLQNRRAMIGTGIIALLPGFRS